MRPLRSKKGMHRLLPAEHGQTEQFPGAGQRNQVEPVGMLCRQLRPDLLLLRELTDGILSVFV